MWATILSAVWTALRWKVESGLLELVWELVEEYQDADIPGDSKKEYVWDLLEEDPRVREFVQEEGSFLLNFAIEVVVARIKARS